MSDLFCAATIIVARHGAANYANPDVIAEDDGRLTDTGRAQALTLAESLRDRKVATIISSNMVRAVQTAEIVAGVLGVSVTVTPGLREFAVGDYVGQPYSPELFGPVWDGWLAGDLSIGCPGAETGADVVRRFRAELETLVDQYRGETVLAISHGGAMSLALPRLVDNVRADYATGRPLGAASTCELAADADGWVLKTWGGQPVG